jgi:hypothetical protein
VPLRFDEGTLGKVQRTPHGGVIVPASVSRVGVQLYRTPDGKVVRELRLPEDVFAPAALASFANAPVTDLHPSELVNPSNHRTHARGHVAGHATHDEKYVNADLAISDAELIEKVERGDAVETSMGYTCKHIVGPGVHPEYGEWDLRQVDIETNHVAIGPRGWNRAGREVALRLDSNAGVIEESRGPVPRTGENPVKKLPKIQINRAKKSLRLDDVDYPIRTKDECDLARNATESAVRKVKEMIRTDAMSVEEARAAVGELVSALEGLMSQVMTLAEGMSEAEPVVDEKKPEPAPAKEEAPAKPDEKMDAAEMDRRVKARVGVITRAASLAPAVKTDGKTDLEIMLDTIKAVDPTIKLDDADAKSEPFVRGVFGALRVENDSLAKARRAAERTDDGSDLDLVEKARRANADSLANAWQKKATA